MDDVRERYTQEIIDPTTGKEYTVNVYPYSWGYKYDVRDNEQGTVIQDGGTKASFSVAMEDGRQWIESREKPARGGGAKPDWWIDDDRDYAPTAKEQEEMAAALERDEVEEYLER